MNRIGADMNRIVHVNRIVSVNRIVPIQECNSRHLISQHAHAQKTVALKTRRAEYIVHSIMYSCQGRSVTSRIGGARLCDATGHAHFISQISQPHTSCLRSTYLHMGKKLSHAYLKTEWCIRGSLEN